MKNLKIYCMCLEDHHFENVKALGYIPVGLGKNNFRDGWLRDYEGQNISNKNQNYGEYTFYYWFWKNILPGILNNHWIGFCSYRELWGNKKKITQNSKFHEVVLTKIPKEWENHDTIIGEPIFINGLTLIDSLI